MAADLLVVRAARDQTTRQRAREDTAQVVDEAKARMQAAAARLREIDREIQRLSNFYQERLDGERRK